MALFDWKDLELGGESFFLWMLPKREDLLRVWMEVTGEVCQAVGNFSEGGTIDTPAKLYSYSKSAINIVNNSVLHDRMKHVRIYQCSIKNETEGGIKLCYFPSQLTNIIWDEAEESDDHIVPYPNQIVGNHTVVLEDLAEKEAKYETFGFSPIETKKPLLNTEQRVELVNNSKYDTHAVEFILDSWPNGSDIPVINVAKNDWDKTRSTESNKISKSSKGGFSADETLQLYKGSESPSEASEKNDYVDYDWANIESFDDLDRIFNDDNSAFGDVNIVYADESWSSCKDGNSCVLKLTPTSSDSSDLPLGALRCSSDTPDEAQYKLGLEESFHSANEKLHWTKSQPKDVQTFGIDEKSQVLQEQQVDDNAAIIDTFLAKGNERKRFLKDQKLKEASKKEVHGLYSTRSTYQNAFEKLNNQYAPSMSKTCPSLVLCQQRQVQRTDLFQQKKFSGPLLASPLYGNMVYHYPNTSLLSTQFQPIDGNCKLGGGDPVKKPADAARTPPAMTPKEKIEKLRRRQQLRVMLAIQKQQQQFGNRVSVENSTTEGRNTEVDESISSFPFLDRNSVIEHGDSNTATMPFSICSIEESVLRQLHDTISRLDVQVRLCIRDSLFRLAKSATQRQCPSDTRSANTSTRDEMNKEINDQEGFTQIRDVETHTNPIDRIMAHLLFHKPMEFSGKHSEPPRSPVSTMPFYERKPNSSESSANGYFPESCENTQLAFPNAPKDPYLYVEMGQSKDRPRLDVVKNASEDGAPSSIGHEEC